MKTKITLGKIDILLDVIDLKSVSIEIFSDIFMEDERDELLLVGCVHDYLLKEGFIDSTHQYSLLFEVNNIYG